MVSNNHARLMQYAAFSSSFLLMNELNAQTEYQEFNPYLPLTNASEVFIDVDDDGIDDFSFYFAKDWGTSSAGYANNNFSFRANQFGDNQVMIDTLPAVDFYSSIDVIYCTFPEAAGVIQLNENSAISDLDNWGKAAVMARVDQCGSYGGDGQQGEWLLDGGTQDYFVGIKLVNPTEYYGWLRIRHNDFGDVDYIKDFYLNSSPGASVVTPDLYNSVAPAADNLNLYYNPDLKLMLEFNAATHEDSLQEYRVILRNSIYTSAFTATICETTAPANYISVNKSGADNYTVDISAINTDWVGNPLAEGEGIKAYVYSKFNHPITMLNGLSGVSNVIDKLTVAIAEQVVNANTLPIWYFDNSLHISTNNIFVASVFITDITGRKVSSVKINSKEAQIDMPCSLTPGIYIVSVITADGMICKQIKI